MRVYLSTLRPLAAAIEVDTMPTRDCELVRTFRELAALSPEARFDFCAVGARERYYLRGPTTRHWLSRFRNLAARASAELKLGDGDPVEQLIRVVFATMPNLVETVFHDPRGAGVDGERTPFTIASVANAAEALALTLERLCPAARSCDAGSCLVFVRNNKQFPGDAPANVHCPLSDRVLACCVGVPRQDVDRAVQLLNSALASSQPQLQVLVRDDAALSQFDADTLENWRLDAQAAAAGESKWPIVNWAAARFNRALELRTTLQKTPRAKRGRPRVNEAEHRRLVAAWGDGHEYPTFAACANALGGGVTRKDVERAVDRERKPGRRKT